MEEKKGLKAWLVDKKDRAKQFCADHPDVVLTVVGGLASIVGGCIKLYANKTEYEDYLYTTDDKGTIYKLPAKQMKTASTMPTSEE